MKDGKGKPFPLSGYFTKRERTGVMQEPDKWGENIPGKEVKYDVGQEMVFALGAIPQMSIPEIKITYSTHEKKQFDGELTSKSCAKFIRDIFPTETIELQEQVIVLYLDSDLNIIGYYRHSIGGIDSVIAEIRIILAAAIKSLSKAIILAHNHPNGSLEPSNNDMVLTTILRKAANYNQVRVLDSMIITKDGYFSFTENGLTNIEIIPVGPDEDPVEGLGKMVKVKPGVLSGNKGKGTERSKIERHKRERMERERYFTEIERIGLNKLSAKLREDYDFIMSSTDNNTDWNFYEQSESIRQSIDNSFHRLEQHISSLNKEDKKEYQPKAKPGRKRASSKKGPPSKHEEKESIIFQGKEVDEVSQEISFIKRFANLHNKKKTEAQILRFFNQVNKAIDFKRIRKSSLYAEEIKHIQKTLFSTYNKMGKSILFEVKPKDLLEKYIQISGTQKPFPAIKYISRFIGIHGRKELVKAKTLLKHIQGALEKGHIPANDPYYERVIAISGYLKAFIDKGGKEPLRIHEAELNGLLGMLSGLGCKCGCSKGKGLGDIDSDLVLQDQEMEEEPNEQSEIISSMDLVKMKFSTYGFTGKYLDFIGDPEKPFSAMIFGRPKYGKSILAVDFAGYLARNHGKVLYVAAEEKKSQKLKEKMGSVAHPNLDVVGNLPESLHGYEFVFVDSVSRLKLSPDDLNALREKYPETSFIFIFQTTKRGEFRGENESQHDVDVVIEVPEPGVAIQYGRFNQGGELRIFDYAEN